MKDLPELAISPCPLCGATDRVDVHGHIQCVTCHFVLVPCCEGTGTDWDAKKKRKKTKKRKSKFWQHAREAAERVRDMPSWMRAGIELNDEHFETYSEKEGRPR